MIQFLETIFLKKNRLYIINFSWHMLTKYSVTRL